MKTLLLLINNFLLLLQASSPSPEAANPKGLIYLSDPYVKFIGGVITAIATLLVGLKAWIEIKKLRHQNPSPGDVNPVATNGVKANYHPPTASPTSFTFGRLAFISLRSIIGLVLGTFHSLRLAIKVFFSMGLTMLIASSILLLILTTLTNLSVGRTLLILFYVALSTFLFIAYLNLCYFASGYASFYGVYGNPANSRTSYKEDRSEQSDLLVNFFGAIYGMLISAAFLYLLAIILSSSSDGLIYHRLWIIAIIPGLLLGVLASHNTDGILDLLSELL
jgi:hypothetical protein